MPTPSTTPDGNRCHVLVAVESDRIKRGEHDVGLQGELGGSLAALEIPPVDVGRLSRELRLPLLAVGSQRLVSCNQGHLIESSFSADTIAWT
eukprot:1801059-Rhodomonas_salina.1